MNISVDPDILRVIQASTAVSTMKGNSVNLLKVGSKRRRTMAEEQELRAQEEEKEHQLAQREQHIQELQAQLAEAHARLEVTEGSHHVVEEMITGGFLTKTK